jgi:hypothetical protein
MSRGMKLLGCRAASLPDAAQRGAYVPGFQLSSSWRYCFNLGSSFGFRKVTANGPVP